MRKPNQKQPAEAAERSPESRIEAATANRRTREAADDRDGRLKYVASNGKKKEIESNLILATASDVYPT